MSKLMKILLPIVVLVSSFFVVNIMVAAKPEPEKKAKQPRLVSLYVDPVEAETLRLTVISHGEVKPKTELDLTALVSGEIIAINQLFAEGASFTKGETLIKIDDSDYKVAVIRAQAQLATAKVNVQRELANSTIKQEQWASKKKRGKPSDYALNIPQIAEAKALLKAAQADLQAAELNLRRTEIKAPFTGRVLVENISIGQYITPSTILGHVFSTDIVEVRLPLTDTQLSELDLPMGFMADASNAPMVNFSSLVGKQLHNWQGRITRTNAAIDQQTRLIYAIAEIVDPYGQGADNDTAIAVGMYVTATISSQNFQNTLKMPRTALHNSNKVYVINDDSKLEIRKVSVLSTTENHVLVADGVKEGEKVVTSTVPTVIDGMLVKALSRDDTELSQQSQG